MSSRSLNVPMGGTRTRAVQVLVQNSETGVFYRGGTAWTKEIDKAFDFRSPDAAERFCRENGLVRVRLTMRLVKVKLATVQPEPAAADAPSLLRSSLS